MTPLPVVRGGSQALYPFVQTYICQTGVSDAQTAASARWVKGPPLVRLAFNYDLLSQSVKNTLKSAFVSAKGQFTSNLSATIGTTFDNLSFDADEFAATEGQSMLYGLKWTLTQTLTQSFSPGTSGAAYPALSTGVIGQLPYTQKKRFQTIMSKMTSGPKYTYAQFGGGLTNFPTDGLMGWEFAESRLTDAEVATKVTHFLANWGNCFPFTFTDEDGTNYSSVYYASPELSITCTGVNQSSIKTALIQLH